MIVSLRKWRVDRGAASTQLVLVIPVLLLLAMLIVQFALVWHARHIAQYAAQRALATARAQHGSAADGRAQAARSLVALGSRTLTTPSVAVERTTTQTTVRVRGTVMAVVPGLHLHASGTAAGPTERLTTPDGGHR
ncbi:MULTISPECIES: TadE/TadG family type IV pilus assembly protein [unclassified Streptomyces]|uniref:TadE/TadG family type IV pilus assembly protein n=1 Tax=unclassified Streptomyces TaxID=2593676 RepID=UPI000378CB0D|nr:MULTISPECIES: TadE/TadG family type IV pilus assembly protein [unclassified Streptomyces]MYT27486.1 pilus assembly protein [Streptomyces sp. SID8354]